MTTLSTSSCDFSHLPLEIWSQILSYLVPSDQTFRIKSRRPNLHVPEPKPPDYLRPEQCFYSWTTKEWEAWEVGQAVVCPDVLPLLLIHPVVYPLALASLYTNNTLWFPDPHTLRHFVQCFSAQAKAAVRRLAVDACGMELSFHGCTSGHSRWELDADIGIVDAITEFPGLGDLRLGGVGPGLMGRVKWVDSWTWHYETGPDWDWDRPIRQRPVSPGLSDGGGRREARDIWPLHCIALVAGIVGHSEIEDDQDGSDARQSPTLSKNAEPRSSLLTGGRVFCARDDDAGDNKNRFSWNDVREGCLRRLGTRIVHRDDDITVGASEIELTDIAAALKSARVENEMIVAFKEQSLRRTERPWEVIGR